MEVVADTCWFIDLEKRRPEAISFLQNNLAVTFILTEIVRAELYAGGRDISRVATLVGSAELLPIDESVSRVWGESAILLRAQGQMIGANDLWLAAICLAHNVPVLTRNPGDFNRVPGLHVISY